jgi:lipopolysaccharide export LptBFGC system permease protein LptF
MQIFSIILSVYAVYFLGNIIYDGFIAKPKVVKSEDGNEPTFVLEDQIPQNIDAEESQVVNFDSVEQFENDDKVILSDLEEKSDEEINVEFEKKMQDEEELTNFEKENSFSASGHPGEIQDSEQSFIASFTKFLKGENARETSKEVIEDDLDVLSFLNNPTKITSFSYANAQLF